MPVFTIASIFATSFVIALSGALMPGPLFAATVSESARRGVAAGPVMMVGHAVLELAMLSALLYGLAPYLTRNAVFGCVAIVGSAVLFWMGLGMFRTLPSLNVDWGAHAVGSGSLVVKGIVMSISNPYWTIWWATIGLGYILYCRAFGMPGIAAFFAGHIMGDVAWYTLVALIVARGRRFLTERIYRWLIGVCAAFIICFACYFAYSGIMRLI